MNPVSAAGHSAGATGSFCLVLHAHLPYVRHAEDPDALEVRWLYEAITGTYLPLLRVFEGLEADGVAFRCTVSLSPPLITMLLDELLRERYTNHLDDLIELADREVERTASEPHYQRVAHFYAERFRALRHTWRSHGGDLVAAFAGLQERGHLEVITATATHAFFPALDRNWPAMRAQVATAVDLYAEHFGRVPQGMWLGECGFVPGCDELLAEFGVRYFFVDSHALLEADPAPVFGVHAPVYCPSGVAAFARDPTTSQQVWSAESGYPGDPHYRDFYRDIGFDLPFEQIKPWLHPEGLRLATGFKYHAITHRHLHDKWVYDPETARGKAGLHATHFRHSLQRQAAELAHEVDRRPLVVSPYDAELYGHWWFEGPIFLDDLFRQLHFDQGGDGDGGDGDNATIETLTPGDYLDRNPVNQLAMPNQSSWGEGGYSLQWVNERNAWTWRHVHLAGEQMVRLAQRHGDDPAPLVRRALAQAARELMLAQSSDWAFILSTETAVQYATNRFDRHIERFQALRRQLDEGRIDLDELERLEELDAIFPHLDGAIYADGWIPRPDP